MPQALRRYCISSLIAIIAFVVLFKTLHHGHDPRTRSHVRNKALARGSQVDDIIHPGFFKPRFRWRNVKLKHPVEHYAVPPSGVPATIPTIQHKFPREKLEHAVERKARLGAVKEAFKHSWQGYKQNAWLQDEVLPLSGASRNPFGGWGATLVDSLDTLWIMGMREEFGHAVHALNEIDFRTTPLIELNVFETTIRYLGGMLSAYDVSGHKYSLLLEKATELGDMLYLAFDTPNRMPVTRWNWSNTILGKDQEARRISLLAEVGSLTLEFTRLSQLTGDNKYYDAVARVTNELEDAQNHTKVPGLWPVFVDAQNAEFTRDTTFTLGGMADSLYEYLPKQHLLLGGKTDQYRNMFLIALAAAKERLFFRPLNPENRRMLLPGTIKRHSATNTKLQPLAEHLACFAGGMVALAAKIFRQPDELETARELVDGCLWAYQSMPTGIMPEIFAALPCKELDWENCIWSEDAWHQAVVEKENRGPAANANPETAESVIARRKLAPGFVEITDARYVLRPEAIESIFVLYRVTGDTTLQDRAWEMFQAITNHTRTSIAFAGLKDVTETEQPELDDNMESFWTAETLKYFYLVFSEPDVISLDQYVLNTEAHPLLRPKVHV